MSYHFLAKAVFYMTTAVVGVGSIRLWGMHICAFVGTKSLKCQLQPHRLNMSHIYNIYLRTVHRGLAPLGQVKDCSLEFLCSLDRLGPKDCPSVVILVSFRQGLATPGKALLQSIFSLESVQHRM